MPVPPMPVVPTAVTVAVSAKPNWPIWMVSPTLKPVTLETLTLVAPAGVTSRICVLIACAKASGDTVTPEPESRATAPATCA